MASADTASRSTGPGEPARPDLRVVALGGGTGLAAVLRGLRGALFESRPWDPERDQARLIAIAPLADDGGSSPMLGRILPSTAQKVVLCAELADGTVIQGESRIASARSPIRRLRLHPSDVSALPEALEALERSDLIVIGPGSLYSSLVAVLLARGLPEAIGRSRAHVVLVMNLMTEPGETDRHTGVDHLLAIRRHAPTIPIQDVLVNTAPFAREQLARHAVPGGVPVPPDVNLLKALGHSVVECDLLATGDAARHDPEKLAHVLLGRVH